MMIPVFGAGTLYLVCPVCRGALEYHESPRNKDRGAACCQTCGRWFPAADGSLNLVTESKWADETTFYDNAYAIEHGGKPARCLDASELARRWHDPHWPECQPILKRLGDVRNKVILCLGNGASVKELYFLHLGAYVIHSDLSLAGVLKAKAKFDLGDFRGRVAFHAMDACTVPLPDNSVDIVYGFEFAHHLPDLTPFLREVERVLKQGGRCVFCDCAYSPLWQTAKRTVLWPIMKVAHWLHPISPEDLRATYAGGYREEEIWNVGLAMGFGRVHFERIGLFQYLLTRGVGVFVGWNWPQWVYRAPGTLGRVLDALLTERVGFLARNRIQLVWGFDKL
jgi:SAM-dependent methyltransferase